MASKKKTDTSSPVEGTPAKTGKVHKCPNCGAVIHHKAKKCSACEATFETSAHVVEAGEKAATKRAGKKKDAPASSETPEIKLLKVLKERGFDVRGSRDIFDPKAEVKIETEKALAPLLEYVPNYNANGRFELGLDQMLGLLKLPLQKH